jgi:hypothetical protein
MDLQRMGMTPRHLTAVSARTGESQALKALLGVPSFLRASASPPQVSRQKAREELIAEAAYLRAASRGFEPGHELDDWLAAEQMVDASLAGKLER